MVEVVIPAEAVTLADCPIGLFTCMGELCLKTEYGNNEGRIDAYIVSSGEFFWGAAPQSIANQRLQMVVPVAADAILATLRSGGEVEWLREALRPFAEPGSSDQYIASDAPDEGWCAARSFRAGDYRRARAALAAAAGGERAD